MSEHIRCWPRKRQKGSQRHGFGLRVLVDWRNVKDPTEAVLFSTNKKGESMSDCCVLSLEPDDIERLIFELRRASAGPLGKLALDAETTTTTVMETDHS